MSYTNFSKRIKIYNYKFRAPVDQQTIPFHGHDNNHDTSEQQGYTCNTCGSNFCTQHSSNRDIGYLLAAKFLQQNPMHWCEVHATFFMTWDLSCILCLNRRMIGLLDNYNFIFTHVHC